MRNPAYSSINPENGDVSFKGPLVDMKGDHRGMPPRTEAYLPGDERGHLTASSLGGVNDPSNIVSQHSDVNHGSFTSVEQGERTVLRQGGEIFSEKTAIVQAEPGERPSTFQINDQVSYADGTVQDIHHSFVNESYAVQAEWNDMTAALPDTFDASNPGDGLRDSMDAESYAELMEETDAALPNLDEDYGPADFSGVPDCAVDETEADISAEPCEV